MKIKPLTSLRFLFAFAVFIHHTDIFNSLALPGWEPISRVLIEGFFGVDFFFILSGFVICYAYKKSIETGKVRGDSFIVYRLARLFPVHFVTFLIAFTMNKSTFGLQAFVNLLMLQSWIPAPQSNFAFTFNAVSWSISTELFFYLAFLLLVKVNRKNLTIIFAFLCAFSLLLVAVANRGMLLDAGWVLYINPFIRVLDFISGMLICQYTEKYRTEQNKVELNKIEQNRYTLMEITSLLSLFLFTTFGLLNNVNWNLKDGMFYLIPGSFIVFAFASGRGAISRLLSKRVFVWLGEISFSFYMIHQLVYLYVVQHYGYLITRISHIAFITCISFFISLISATVLYYVVEKPLNNLIRKGWDKYILKVSN